MSRPSTSAARVLSVGATASGFSALFVVRTSAAVSVVAPASRWPAKARTSAESSSSSVVERLTASRVTAPVSSSWVAVASSSGTSPCTKLSYDATSGSTRSTCPRANAAAWANGWKIVWRQAGPPGSVRIGAMTFTSCAWHAIPTRSAWRSRVMSRLPTTAASTTSYVSSISRRASTQSVRACSGSFQFVWYHTFHSSTETRSRRRDLRRAPTWSAVATTASMARSRSTLLPRKSSAVASTGS